MKVRNGFTLIELVLVLVLIASLAVVAMPKFLDMQAQSRIAALNGLAAAVHGAAMSGRSLCALQQGCDMNGNACNGHSPAFTYNGKTIFSHYGWPTGWGQCHVDDYVGSIGDMVTVSSDFQLSTNPGLFNGVYQLKTSPDPSNCKVVYLLSSNSPSMSVSVVSSGC